MTTELRTEEPRGQWGKEIEKESKGTKPALQLEFVYVCTETKSLGAKPPACPFPRFTGYQCSFTFLMWCRDSWKEEGFKGKILFYLLISSPHRQDGMLQCFYRNTDHMCIDLDTDCAHTHHTESSLLICTLSPVMTLLII